MQKGSFDAEKKTVQLQSSLVGNASKVSDQTWSSQRGVILPIHNGSFIAVVCWNHGLLKTVYMVEGPASFEVQVHYMRFVRPCLQTGYCIHFGGCPLVAKGKLHECTSHLSNIKALKWYAVWRLLFEVDLILELSSQTLNKSS